MSPSEYTQAGSEEHVSRLPGFQQENTSGGTFQFHGVMNS